MASIFHLVELQFIPKEDAKLEVNPACQKEVKITANPIVSFHLCID